jgi:hypothetical protein
MPAKFTCQFTTDNDAFYDDDGNIADYSTLVANQIDEVSAKVRAGRTGGAVMDTNGNKIGSWKLR